MKLRVRVCLVVVLIFLVFAVAAILRVVSSSQAELARGDAALESGEVPQAIRHYRRAIRWTVPSSPYPERAVAALEELARRLEAEGDTEGALSAWRAISGGSTATRMIWSGRDLARQRADDEIARLLAAHGRVAMDAGLEDVALRASHRALLRTEVRADPFWGTLLLVGFATWVAGLVSLVARGFDKSGRASWARARLPLTIALIGLSAFILGMLFA